MSAKFTVRIDSRISVVVATPPNTHKDLIYNLTPYLDEYGDYNDDRALTYILYVCSALNSGLSRTHDGKYRYSGEIHGYYQVEPFGRPLVIPFRTQYRFIDFENRPSIIIEFDLEIKASQCPATSFLNVISSNPISDLRNDKKWIKSIKSFFGVDVKFPCGVISFVNSVETDLSPYSSSQDKEKSPGKKKSFTSFLSKKKSGNQRSHESD